MKEQKDNVIALFKSSFGKENIDRTPLIKKKEPSEWFFNSKKIDLFDILLVGFITYAWLGATVEQFATQVILLVFCFFGLAIPVSTEDPDAIKQWIKYNIYFFAIIALAIVLYNNQIIAKVVNFLFP